MLLSTTDTTETQMNMRKYYEELYANKLENLKEIDKFQDTYNLQRLNQENTDNLQRPIPNNDIKAVTKSLSSRKGQGPNGFTEFYKIFKEEVTSILFKLFNNTEQDGTLQTLL